MKHMVSNKDKSQRFDTGKRDDLNRPIYNWGNTDRNPNLIIENEILEGYREDFNSSQEFEKRQLEFEELQDDILDEFDYVNDDNITISYNDGEETVDNVEDFANNYAHNKVYDDEGDHSDSFDIKISFPQGKNYFETQANKQSLHNLIKDNNENKHYTINEDTMTIKGYFGSITDYKNTAIKDNNLAKNISTISNDSKDKTLINTNDKKTVYKNISDNFIENNSEFFDKTAQGWEEYYGKSREELKQAFEESVADYFVDYDSNDKPEFSIVDANRLMNTKVAQRLIGENLSALYTDKTYKQWEDDNRSSFSK